MASLHNDETIELILRYRDYAKLKGYITDDAFTYTYEDLTKMSESVLDEILEGIVYRIQYILFEKSQKQS